MAKLKLGPIANEKPVKLTIELPAAIHRDLLAYAEVYGETYGNAVGAAALAPHMLASFMEGDRGFRRVRQEPASRSCAGGASTLMSSAISTTSETAAESYTPK